MKYHKIDGEKCRKVIDSMFIKYPAEIKTQSIKDKLRRFMLTLPLTNRKESNTTQYKRPLYYISDYMMGKPSKTHTISGKQALIEDYMFKHQWDLPKVRWDK